MIRTATTTAAAAFAVFLLSACQNETATKDLFNGNDLSGWHLYNEGAVPSIWHVDQGTLVCDPLHDGAFGDLITDQTFENFHFHAEWRASAGANSGFFFHVEERADLATPWMSGIEYQILDNEDSTNHNYGDLYRITGSLYGMCPVATAAAYKPVGQWNVTDVEVRGDEVKFFLNGELMLEQRLEGKAWAAKKAESSFAQFEHYGQARRGYIGLQAWHGRVQFRNLTIEPVEGLPL